MFEAISFVYVAYKAFTFSQQTEHPATDIVKIGTFGHLFVTGFKAVGALFLREHASEVTQRTPEKTREL